MKRIFPASFYNPITLAGSAIASISFGLIVFLTVLEALAKNPKPYLGILTFVVLPAILIIGLLLIAFGIMREHRREKLGKPHGLNLPTIDLNNPRHRTALTFFVFGTILLIGFSAFGSFKAYEYTDSDEFCGETCHKVMSPEFTAYQFSPHARVGCAQCHIGPGAGWFVRSKLSGAYQVYATLFNKYPRPIPTPIENLRPARETCEQCHWPKNFFSEKQHVLSYYLSDEQNTKWTLNLLMKTGGGNIEAGPTSGIHWHMNIAHEVTYAAIDSGREVIPWIQSKKPDGSVTVFRNKEIDVSEEQLRNAERRKMDCIDCHNRPTHIYHHPAQSVNTALSLGWIDPKLPSAKSICVKALEFPYSTKESAMDSIKLVIEDFYKTNYPEVASSKKETIEQAIKQVQTIFSRNYFPEMQVSWKRFPNHIGHMYTEGCFRCHDGKHVSDDGRVLSRDCNTCHTILAQQYENDSLHLSLSGVEYRHPVDIGDAWKEMNCSECHKEQ
ncbi:MAG: NapC/NirT family cytochrome c [Ignavibacteriales bacterium]|nr:NapC/NirT family cytochrome c [Ignavibacteriales bacterium]